METGVNSGLYDVWGKEQKLILLLDKIRHHERLVEGARKTKEIDDRQDAQMRPAILTEPSITVSRQPISAAPNRMHINRYQGGSIDERLRALRGDTDGGPGTALPQQISQDIYIIGRSTLSSSLEAPRQAGGLNAKQAELATLRTKASELSADILSFQQQNHLEIMCDTISARDIDLKIGGDGFFRDSEGLIQIIPSTPLAQTCTGRKGQMGKDRVWILECVLCPAYYADNPDRLKQWIEFSETRKNQDYDQAK